VIRHLPHAASRHDGRGPRSTPPWVVDHLFERFLDDFWSAGAGELTEAPLDAERAPREAYVRVFGPRAGSGEPRPDRRAPLRSA
jgi:hypothetical protein